MPTGKEINSARGGVRSSSSRPMVRHRVTLGDSIRCGPHFSPRKHAISGPSGALGSVYWPLPEAAQPTPDPSHRQSLVISDSFSIPPPLSPLQVKTSQRSRTRNGRTLGRRQAQARGPSPGSSPHLPREKARMPQAVSFNERSYPSARRKKPPSPHTLHGPQRLLDWLGLEVPVFRFRSVNLLFPPPSPHSQCQDLA